MSVIRHWISLLFTPAVDAGRLAKAPHRGADAIIVDLEDAIAADRKDAARGLAREAVMSIAATGLGAVVRVNSEWIALQSDLAAVVRPGLSAIMVPKVENLHRLAVVCEILGEFEARAAASQGSIGVVALIEGPQGLSVMGALVKLPQVSGLAFGPEDFAASFGREPEPNLLDLSCRMVALAAARSGLAAIGAPGTLRQLDDMAPFRAAATTAWSYGMTGLLCVHPRQVAVANAVFGSNPARRTRAKRIVVGRRAHPAARSSPSMGRWSICRSSARPFGCSAERKTRRISKTKQ